MQLLIQAIQFHLILWILIIQISFSHNESQVDFSFGIPQLHHRFGEIFLIRQIESGEFIFQETQRIDSTACDRERIPIDNSTVILHRKMHIRTIIMLQILYIDRIMIGDNIPVPRGSSLHLYVFVQRVLFDIIIIHTPLGSIICTSVEHHGT